MPTTVGKNLNLCFIKIKFPLASSSLLTSADNSLPLPSSAATSSSLHFNNHNSPFKSTQSFPLSSDSNPDLEPDSEPDIATIFASRRFFFTSPGTSNSIIESTPASTTTTTPESSHTIRAAGGFSRSSNKGQPTSTVKGSLEVPTFSPNPYMDFRRSMQEMVEARELNDVKANWDYLHELLLCYLALNPKSTHKFIIGAFADLVVSLMSTEGGGGDY